VDASQAELQRLDGQSLSAKVNTARIIERRANGADHRTSSDRARPVPLSEAVEGVQCRFIVARATAARAVRLA
jgi:hypothetical protein